MKAQLISDQLNLQLRGSVCDIIHDGMNKVGPPFNKQDILNWHQHADTVLRIIGSCSSWTSGVKSGQKDRTDSPGKRDIELVKGTYRWSARLPSKLWGPCTQTQWPRSCQYQNSKIVHRNIFPCFSTLVLRDAMVVTQIDEHIMWPFSMRKMIQGSGPSAIEAPRPPLEMTAIGCWRNCVMRKRKIGKCV